LINIWADDLAEEEKRLVNDETAEAGPYYSAHAHALQSFVEKVTVFKAATNYKDDVLTTNAASDSDTFKLGVLYDRYFEYAELLSTQWLVKEAVSF